MRYYLPMVFINILAILASVFASSDLPRLFHHVDNAPHMQAIPATLKGR